MVSRFQVRLTAAEERAAAAQSSEAKPKEALKKDKEWHSKELKQAHLVGRACRRMQVFEDEILPFLNGIPVTQGSGKRKNTTASIAPPPTEVSPERTSKVSGETSIGGGTIGAAGLFLLPDSWMTGIPSRSGGSSSSKTCILLRAGPTS